jgi:cobalamin biosynthesis protein CobD/CbiB
VLEGLGRRAVAAGHRGELATSFATRMLQEVGQSIGTDLRKEMPERTRETVVRSSRRQTGALQHTHVHARRC